MKKSSKSVKNSNYRSNIALGAIIRNDKVEIPNPHSSIHPDDELLLFTKPENLSSAERLFR